MDAEALRSLIDGIACGEVEPDEAVRLLRALPFADVGNARVDHHRAIRQGMPEAVYGPGKTPEDVALIVAELLAGGSGPVVLTRADKEQVTAALAVDAAGTVRGSTAIWRRADDRPEQVAVVTAGTADLPVADECAAVLWAHGFEPVRITDVGVAGIHRLLAEVETLQAADAVVVVAGMEGALASVVGGLTGAPVTAVPTSVGYGASLEGVTALLGMLASCASGLTVVGIDNGFGAACAVLRQLGARR
jgi:NCAIR mutase (PurE)-related protein